VDFSNESRNLQIANYLKTLRLEQNMTLEQLSDASYVPIVHLTSIEDGRFSRFDDFYLKMYLKRYTQILGVDLKQLYAYAMQQPIEDLPKRKREDPIATGVNPNSMQHKVHTQPATIETPHRRKPQVKRNTSTVSPLGPAHTKPKVNIGKFLIGLFLVALIAIFLFFIVDFFINISNREDTPDVPPPVIENPHDLIPPDPSDDEGDDSESDDGEAEEIEEPELESEEKTTIEFNDRTGQTQTFILITSHNEIELRMEHHSGPNWVGGFLNGTGFINATYQEGDTLEESFAIENDDVFRLTAGAIQAVEAIFINDVEVDFLSDGLSGAENLDFTITIQSE
jgi:cytoskeletal protein RodZ